MNLTGQTVLITGAARRIGQAMALYLARAGADILIHHGHSANDAEQTAAEIRGMGGKAWVLQADLEDLEQAASLVERAWEIQPFQHLINNAAIFDQLDWVAVTPADWQKTLNINLTAPFFLSQQFAKKLAGQPGRILNLLDWRALRPGADHLPYTISKAALAALTQSLALALAPSVTVNGLALGAVLPPSDSSDSENILKAVPAKRWADLSEVGEATLFFLAGPEYITGEILHLDGGRHLD
ncbi:MAG TPA: short-chain dehydrogenase [Anaerolineaceae bacterium]|nr:short-chain dehydrogenase [Anaerolineaceae bacterium]